MSQLDDKLKKIAGDDSQLKAERKPRSKGRPFVKGDPRAGRPPGRPNYITEMRKGIEKLAKENKMTPTELTLRLYAMGFKKAGEGDYNFFKDFLDRTHGKPIQPVVGPEDDEGKDGPILIRLDL